MGAQPDGRPKIIARFRPLSDREGRDECVSVVPGAQEVHLTATGASHRFTFDDVLVRDCRNFFMTSPPLCRRQEDACFDGRLHCVLSRVAT